MDDADQWEASEFDARADEWRFADSEREAARQRALGSLSSAPRSDSATAEKAVAEEESGGSFGFSMPSMPEVPGVKEAEQTMKAARVLDMKTQVTLSAEVGVHLPLCTCRCG